jgi:ATP-dependent Clp protease ATP-binding subunit ClpA
MTAPPDLHELDEKIATTRREKESAIDAQDFEKAASLRDTEKQSRTASRSTGRLSPPSHRRPRRTGSPRS